MQPAAILQELIHSEDLPREALRAAGERRAEMVPLLIGQIENYLAGESSELESDGSLLIIFHLLGEWRERSAYRTLARFLRSDPDRLESAIGDATTETAHKIMAAVFDGDPAPIYNIILDASADEYVRSAMCETLAMLAVDGRLDREEAASFLRDCWISLQPRDGCFVWHGWQSAIARLGLVELRDVVKEAFDRRIVDPRWLHYQHFEHDLALALLSPTDPWGNDRDNFAPFGGTVDELSTWYCFTEECRRARERARNAPPLPLFPPREPATNPLRGIGRNDPCPCGSGKKYKKCCLQ